MLHWATMFFTCSILCALFGFGKLVNAEQAGIFQVLFVTFTVLAVISLILGRKRPR
jgi:uncharacterized membrane protein YtjA (UPF0391 family)